MAKKKPKKKGISSINKAPQDAIYITDCEMRPIDDRHYINETECVTHDKLNLYRSKDDLRRRIPAGKIPSNITHIINIDGHQVLYFELKKSKGPRPGLLLQPKVPLNAWTVAIRMLKEGELQARLGDYTQSGTKINPKHKELYIERCLLRVKDLGAAEKLRIKRIRDNMSHLQNQIRQLASEESEATKRMSHAKADHAKTRDFVAAEFDKIVQSNQFAKVLINKDCLIGVTRELLIKHKDKNYSLGSFRINIYLPTGRVSLVHQVCPKNRNGGYIKTHPHSNLGDGWVCWGNIAAAVERLSVDKEYSSLLFLVKNFLESPEPEHVNTWINVNGAMPCKG